MKLSLDERFQEAFERNPDFKQEVKIYKRRLGNTTAQCLYLISQAMTTPNKKIKLTDYVPGFPELETSKRNLKKNLVKTLVECIEKLHLSNLKIDIVSYTLTYDIPWLEDL